MIFTPKEIFVKQLFNLTLFNMKARYRKTLAGFFWVIINPIFIFVSQAIVFKFVFKVNVDNYLLFILSGLLPWIFISSTIIIVTPSIQSSRNLLSSFKINPFVIIWATVVDNVINFIFSFSIIFFVFLYFGKASSWSIIFFPFVTFILFLGAGLIVSILSIMQIFYRDTVFVSTFFLNIMFFFTPIFYPKEYIPEEIRWMLNANVFYLLIDPFRYSFYHLNVTLLSISIIKSVVVIGLLYFFMNVLWKKKKNEFYAQL